MIGCPAMRDLAAEVIDRQVTSAGALAGRKGLSPD